MEKENLLCVSVCVFVYKMPVYVSITLSIYVLEAQSC